MALKGTIGVIIYLHLQFCPSKVAALNIWTTSGRQVVNRSPHCSQVGYPIVKIHIEVGDPLQI